MFFGNVKSVKTLLNLDENVLNSIQYVLDLLQLL